MIKAVIFDMDGLLIDSEPVWHKTNTRIYKTFGVRLTQEDFNHMRGRAPIENIRHHLALHNITNVSAEDIEKQVIDAMVSAVKAELSVMPGVDEVMQICRGEKLKMAIASSSPMRLIEAVVDVLEIREHLHHIYSAQFEPYGKPHPGVFLKVAEHFKVLPTECLVFEDSPAGVLAAKAANMKCVAVPAEETKNHAFVQTADLILGSLEDFDEQTLKNL